MDIVCATDNNFLLYLGVALCSVCENNGGQELNFHIIVGDDVPASGKAMLSDMVGRYGGRTTFYSINESVLAELPVGQPGQPPHISAAAYYRLFLASILPETVDKVLYLDCDIINVADLTALWDTDIDGYALAAAPDVIECCDLLYERLHYPAEFGYFNSGVLLVNLKYWRENHLQEEFLNFWKQHPERVLFHDQDILNYVLKERKRVLHLKYNVQEPLLHEVNPLPEKYQKEVEEALANHVIIHFTTPSKPWVKGCRHTWKEVFYEYHKKSGLPRFKLVAKGKTSFYWKLRGMLVQIGLVKPLFKYRTVSL